jgi:hypothetical protein
MKQMGVLMEELSCPESLEVEPIPERDILSWVAMLDYLVGEIAKVDTMSASCLLMARKSLLEAVADALVKAH